MNATFDHMTNARSPLYRFLRIVYWTNEPRTTCTLCNDEPDDITHFATCSAHADGEWKSALSDTCASSATIIGQPISDCRRLASILHEHIIASPKRNHLRLGLVSSQNLAGLLALFPESDSKAVARTRSKFLRTTLLRAAHTMWVRRQAAIVSP